jgi:hypothetical protein
MGGGGQAAGIGNCGVRTRRTVRSALAAAAAAVPLALPVVLAPVSRAATDNYTGISGNWSTGTKWSLAVPPNPGDTAVLTNNGALNVTVTYDAAAGTGTGIASLTLTASNGGTVTLSQALNLLTVSGNEIVGSATNGTGALVLSGGTHTIGGNLTLGNTAGAVGNATLSGTARLVVSGSENFGALNSGGNGSFVQSGGTNSTGILNLANGLGSTGTYTLSGGTLSVSTDETIGTGTFTQSGGSHTVGGTLTMSNFIGTIATYNLQGGTLSATELRVSDQTSGTFNHTGGTNSVGTLRVGATFNQNGGTYNLSGTGSSVTVSGNGFVGEIGSGLFSQTNGAATFGNLFIGNFAAGKGTNSLSAGTQTINGSEYVGFSGLGSLVVSGGAHAVNGGGTNGLFVGQNAGSTGTVTFSGGNIAASVQRIGVSGIGVFNQSGNAVNAMNTLVLGDGAGGVGSYLLSGSAVLNNFGNQFIGNNGAGVFTQSGGLMQLTGSIFVGNAATGKGTNSLSGGTQTIPVSEFVGFNGSGTLNLTGGTHSLTANDGTNGVFFGYNAGSTGSGTMSGTAVLTATNASEVIGYGGAGTFAQSGGTNLVSWLEMGHLASGNGTYTLSGGTLTVTHAEILGTFGSGTFTQTGGTHTVSALNGVQVGTGTFNLQGGTLSASGMALEAQNGNANATVNHSGGTNTLGFLDVGDTAGSRGTYNLSGTGFLSVSNDATVGFLGAGTFNQSGGTAQINGDLILGEDTSGKGTNFLSGGSLTVGGNETIGREGTGTFNQSGGTHTIGGNLVLANLSVLGGPAGTYSLNSGRLVVGGDESVGEEGLGTLTQLFGSIHNVTGNLTLGRFGVGNGSLTLTFFDTLTVGGSVRIGGDTSAGGTGVVTVGGFGSVMAVGGGIKVWDTPGTALNLTGGSITAASLDTSGNPSRFSWTGGNLTLTAGGLTIGAGGNAGPSVTLGTNQMLSTSGPVLILGTLTQSGGTNLSAVVQNQGTFTYNAGGFAGRLFNQGTVNINGDLTAGNGVENDATLTVLLGRTVTANGAGFLNVGTLTMDGGTIGGSSITNDFGGLMNARGTFNAPLVNNGTINLTGLLNVNAAAANAGVITAGSGETFHVGPSSGFTNSGAVSIAGGAFTGGNGFINAPGGVVSLFTGALSSGGTVTNSAGATLQGYGNIASTVANSGLIYANTGGQTLTVSALVGAGGGGELRVADGATLNIGSPFSSGGLITLQGANAQLAGASLMNVGTLGGVGRVNNTVVNLGVIRGEGGQLTMAGPGNTNPAGGSIQAPPGGTVLFSQGLATNAGLISLTGGTFDNGNQPMTNAAGGRIEGRGTLRTGGLTSAGAITLADAPSDVIGPVTVASGGKLNITNTTATFFDAFTVNAGGTVKTTAAVARFLAGSTINGVFTSDPADNLFSDLTVGPGGALTGGVGDRFFITGNLVNGSALADAWDTRAAELHFSGGAAHLLTTPAADRGASFDGYDGNFAWGMLEVTAGESLIVGDADSIQGAGLYVSDLVLDGGAMQLARLSTSTPDVSIYYDATRAANAYLGGQSYPLNGGGSLVPVPEPGGLALLGGAGAGGLLCRCRRRRSGGRGGTSGDCWRAVRSSV